MFGLMVDAQQKSGEDTLRRSRLQFMVHHVGYVPSDDMFSHVFEVLLSN